MSVWRGRGMLDGVRGKGYRGEAHVRGENKGWDEGRIGSESCRA